MRDSVFSPMEQKVLKILGRKKMSIAQIAEEFYKDQKPTISPNNSVAGAINSINKKCVFHNQDFLLDGEGLGRGGRVVFKIKR